MKYFTAGLVLLAAVSTIDGAVLRVVSLNPIATDLARQVGGGAVEIIELMEPGRDPHTYAPTPSDLKAADGAPVILAMGKGLETYLERLRDTLSSTQKVFEIGKQIPSLACATGVTPIYGSHEHSHGPVDPHWWHSVRNMRRAAFLMADEFSLALPAEATGFQLRAQEYGRRMDALEKWANQEMSRIPVSQRVLATAHAGFNYFCQDYQFRAVPILGLSTLDQPRPGQFRVVLDIIKTENIRAVFPEVAANPVPLKTVAREAGIRVGEALLAGSPTPEEPTFEAMFRHNVKSIVTALAPGEGVQ